jgi:hypothetical protein
VALRPRITPVCRFHPSRLCADLACVTLLRGAPCQQRADGPRVAVKRTGPNPSGPGRNSPNHPGISTLEPKRRLVEGLKNPERCHVVKTNAFLAELRDGLGVRRLADLRSQTVAPGWWDVVAGAYANLSELCLEPPPKQAHELRPTIAASAVSQVDEAEVAARSLLLAPTVAILLPDSGNYARYLLRLATLLEPAIDAGLVILLPETSIAEYPYFDAALMSGYNTIPPNKEERERNALSAVQRLEIALAMDAVSRFPERLDLAVATKGHLDRVRELLETPLGGQRAPETDRVRFLPDLMSLKIPRLALGVDDFVRMRADGLFEEVREGLTEALRRTSSLTEAEVVDPDSVRVREIRQYLDEVAARTVKATKQSRVLRTAVTGTLALGVGAATGALGSVGGIELGAAAGMAGSAAALVVGWLGGRPLTGERRFRQTVTRLFGEEPA